MFKVNNSSNNLLPYLVILELNILKINIELRVLYKGNYTLVIIINNYYLRYFLRIELIKEVP